MAGSLSRALCRSEPLNIEQGCGLHRESLIRDMLGLEVTVEKARGKSELKQVSWYKPKGTEQSQGRHLCY